MRRTHFLITALVVVFSAISPRANAAAPSPADFPLRVHVYQTKWQKQPRGFEGEGRANLFEHGQARGFDYTFSCPEPFRASIGWETYPAKWRTRDGELLILVPVAGRPGAHSECLLKVVMKKDVAYYRRNGQLNEEPASVFKEWMEKHQYDPEHGKNQPAGLAGDAETGPKKK